MKQRSVLALVYCALLLAAATPARSEPSVLVQTAPLQKGSLPRIVTAYGSVQGSSSSRQTIMAPLAATVSEVYVRQGEAVAKDAPLVQLMPSPKAASDYAQAQSALHNATDLKERTQKMLKQHLATAQQLADAKKSEADAKATLTALQTQGAGGPNVLKAPASAIVTALSTNPGAIVAEGAPLLELAQTHALVLTVGVVPAKAADLAPGNEATITPIGEKQSATGKVLLRGSVVDAATGLVPVEIALPDENFFPGEMAEAAITTGELQGYIVPHAALLVDDKGAPYVVQDIGGTAKKVDVQVLGGRGDQNIIDGQLDPSAPLVVSGNYQLEDGMKVRTVDPDGKAAP
ncbi:MAG: efflux RND transporter periplasmic adaptor subunit [Alphaproteobacteria bacterium]|nr:efflux RND transporter periplasmic adaptor subunit [Alphaproteobacteria bacterium]